MILSEKKGKMMGLMKARGGRVSKKKAKKFANQDQVPSTEPDGECEAKKSSRQRNYKGA